MRNQWFIIQTLSGQEHKVKDSIEKRVKTDEMQDFIKEVLVPMEKVVEVRNSGFNKGTAGLEWLAAQDPDFILGIGDDWTDEDLFRALPAPAISVRVGVAATNAKYYLTHHLAVRRLLRELSETPCENSHEAIPVK